MSAATVQPERILKDLQQLWAQMAVDQAESGGVLRACAMTLVVAAENAADAERVRQTVGVLMHNHPSRAVILRSGGQNGADLDARIFAECWKPFGKTQQICSEGIEITAGQSGFSEVAKFLVPLRVPDLPVVLWCRGKCPRSSRDLWSRCSRWPTKSSSILPKSRTRIARCSFCAGFAGAGGVWPTCTGPGSPAGGRYWRTCSTIARCCRRTSKPRR